MEKYIVNYETALKLKQIGFDEPCHWRYDTKHNELIFGSRDDKPVYHKNSSKIIDFLVSAPLYDQVLEWFRGKGYHLEIQSPDFPAATNNEWCLTIHTINRFGNICNESPCDTYEEARQKGIDWIINKMKDGTTN